MKRLLMLLGLSLLLLPGFVLAQGVTTASVDGQVTDLSGEALPGANVVLVDTRTGVNYGTSTRIDGRYNIPNLPVGGPYTLTVSFVGFEAVDVNDIHLQLGQTLTINQVLVQDITSLEEIIISDVRDEDLNPDRTGAATTIDREKLRNLPTISRSQQDYTRLTPQSDGNSFGGRNVLYNNFSLDGSIFNNSFGLDAPTPGGQTNSQPVSLDAIDQLIVSIAPFDVRQGGFTGAGVNAVTKSGTNEFSGSVYTFMRNESLIGDKVSGQEVTNPDLKYNQSGFRLGGPIIKNKLFFFINGEIERRDDPGSNFVAARPGLSGPNVSRVEASVMDQIRSLMLSSYGYETGPYENYIYETNNDKFLAKLDWNISNSSRLSLRYNYLRSTREQGPHPFAINFTGGRVPSQNTLPFRNSGYAINNNIDSFVGELNTRFGNTASNKLTLGYTAFRDFRTPFSTPFPTIEVAEAGTSYTTIGHEPFSINNVLDQNVFQFTDDFSIFKGNHVYTIGTNLEVFDFNNSFNLFYYGIFPIPAQFGGYSFGSVASLLDAISDPTSPTFRDFNAEVAAFDDAPFSLVELTVGQLGLYVQDENTVSSRLKLTYGLRVDLPLYFSDIPANPALANFTFEDAEDNPLDIDVSELPTGNLMFSPRFGFNYDVSGDRSTQLRGGTGIFSGRVPFVWLSNQAGNRGANDPSNVGTINYTENDFRFPQVWKTNIALDHKLADGLFGGLEMIYGKDLNAITVYNANLDAPVPARTLADGRPRFDPANNTINPEVAGAYVIGNTNDGSQLNITGKLRKTFASGIDASVAYNYNRSRDVLTSTEISQFLFEGNAVAGDPNQPTLGFSQFGLQHRIIASGGYSFEYGSNFKTSFALFYELAQGNRASYTYSGDLNGDGVGGNDLVYIPRDASEINLVDITDGGGNVITSAAQQWQQLDAFIAQDDYLSANRGSIMERNGAVAPWFSQLDLRILQDINFLVGTKKNTLQLSLDILNFGNLINSNWGVRQLYSITQPITYVGDNGAGDPQFQYNNLTQSSFVDDPSLASRWRAQFGIRYIFN